MHTAIAQFPNQQFYGNRLLTHASVINRKAKEQPAWMEDPLLKVRYLLFNANEGAESAGSGDSKANRGEAALTVKLFQRLHRFYDSNDCWKNLAIVTPYSAQKYVRRAVHWAHPPTCTISC